MTDDPLSAFPRRPGEERFRLDPADADDGRLAFVGRIRSPWTTRGDCPKNLRQARERRRPAAVEIHEPFRPALAGLAEGDWVFLLTWLDRTRRDLAVQTPKHADKPRGTFSLRSPVRPNPIGLHLVRIVSLEAAGGDMVIDAIDVLDGTPLLDIKPYIDTTDRPPESLPES